MKAYYVEWETEPECEGSPLGYRFFTNKAEARKFIRNDIRGFPRRFEKVQLPTQKGDWITFLNALLPSGGAGLIFVYGSEEVDNGIL